jgi:hypothetical protein
VDDRNSVLEDTIEIKQKTGEFLNKKIKSNERSTHEFCDSFKRPNL